MSRISRRSLEKGARGGRDTHKREWGEPTDILSQGDKASRDRVGKSLLERERKKLQSKLARAEKEVRKNTDPDDLRPQGTVRDLTERIQRIDQQLGGNPEK